MLQIKNLFVNVKNTFILKGLNLLIKPGEIHAIMGPNGSGKTTLAYTLAGKETNKIIKGTIIYKNKNILTFNPEERASEGIFLSFQSSIEIPGLNNNILLYSAINSIRKYHKKCLINFLDFNKIIKNKIKLLKINYEFINRSFNIGFSGGEKKK